MKIWWVQRDYMSGRRILMEAIGKEGGVSSLRGELQFSKRLWGILRAITLVEQGMSCCTRQWVRDHCEHRADECGSSRCDKPRIVLYDNQNAAQLRALSQQRHQIMKLPFVSMTVDLFLYPLDYQTLFKLETLARYSKNRLLLQREEQIAEIDTHFIVQLWENESQNIMAAMKTF